MKHRGITSILGSLLPMLLAAGCYPSGPSEVGESDVVVTAFDQNQNFGAIRTWAMPDEVFETEGSDDVTDAFDGLILSQIEANMTRLGYVRERNPEANGADVVIIARKSRRTTTGWVGGGVPGWCGWPGWGFPGWGCWPGFYPWIPVSVTTGSVFVEMYDPNAAVQLPSSSETQLPAVWGALLNGFASGTASNAARISEGIDQAFRQSPYLGRQ